MLLARDDLLYFEITSMGGFFFLSIIIYLSELLLFDRIEIVIGDYDELYFYNGVTLGCVFYYFISIF